MSSEGRTKWSLYDQDYTKFLYSCLCWVSHLFKTTTSNISKTQWPHLGQSESICGKLIHNSPDRPPNTNHAGLMKGITDPSSPFSAPDSAPHYFISVPFQTQVTPPLQESLCWCTKSNECKVRSTAVKPPTSHLQDPNSISYCLSSYVLASLW